MRVVLVEDDHVQAEEFGEVLTDALPNAKLDTIGSEHGFYSMLDELEKDPPDLIIMDVMLRWARPSPEMPEAPEEVILEQHYRAGFRCVKRLSERKALRSVKVILYTVLETVDIGEDLKSLPGNVSYLVKDEDYNSFIGMIRRLTASG